MFMKNCKALKILLIEAEPLTKQVHCKLLEFLGHSVKCVANEAEAIASIDDSYDCIFLDINCGLEVVTTIQQQNNQSHTIIAITNYLIDEIYFKCRKLGINHILKKPISPYLLNETINSF